MFDKQYDNDKNVCFLRAFLYMFILPFVNGLPYNKNTYYISCENYTYFRAYDISSRAFSDNESLFSKVLTSSKNVTHSIN